MLATESVLVCPWTDYCVFLLLDNVKRVAPLAGVMQTRLRMITEVRICRGLLDTEIPAND